MNYEGIPFEQRPNNWKLLDGKKRDMKIFYLISQHPGRDRTNILVRAKSKISREGFGESIDNLEEIGAIGLKGVTDYSNRPEGKKIVYAVNKFFPLECIDQEYLEAHL